MDNILLGIICYPRIGRDKRNLEDEVSVLVILYPEGDDEETEE